MACHVVDFLGQVAGGIYKITAEQERKFVFLAKQTAKHRYRVCFHASPNSDFHNMLICSLRDSYCRPHRHFGSPEFHTIITGKNAVLFFDDEGRLIEHFVAARDDGVISYRIDTGVWHMEIPLTSYVLDAESRKGPIDSNDNIFASWSPDGQEREMTRKFVSHCMMQAGLGYLAPSTVAGADDEKKEQHNHIHKTTYGLDSIKKSSCKMKVLVTGAGGFIGSFLALALHQFGHDVTALVHQQESVPSNSQISYVVQDLEQNVDLEDRFDVVIHAAGVGGERNCPFLEFKHGNADSMENLLSWAETGHVKRIIYLSSISIYGEVRTDCVNEMTPIVNPSAYGLCKYSAERLLAETSKIDHIALRMPGIFGRYARYPWLAKVVESCIQGTPVKIYSPNFVNNNYLYLPDLAIFINSLLQKGWSYPELVLALQQGVTIREAVETVRRTLGSTSEIIVTETETKPFRIDIERALSMGYKSHSFQAMINECLACGGWRS